MLFRHWSALRTSLAVAALLSSTRAGAQSLDTTSFVTMQGRDTIAIEQYTRAGNTITGAWIQHQNGVYVHDYALVLRNDGWPDQYVMTLYTQRPHTFLLSVTYGSDSATRIVVRDSVARTERVIVQKAYPIGALSIVGLELALARARQAHTDSTSIILDRAEVKGPSPALPVRFFGADSVRIGDARSGRVDQSGRLLALRDGPRETRRVSTFDAARLTAGFVRADSVLRASRVAIALPRATLERYVGEYSLNPTTLITLALEADKLMVRTGGQPAVQLLPLSPTKFFVEANLGLSVEFETDPSGNVTAMTLVQSGARQRAPKTK
jgi:hypothetical protein